MNIDKIQKRDLYYTTDHEQIDFQGTIAYVGACSLKLSGIKHIDQLTFEEMGGFKQQGELIARIDNDNYLININMPASGRLSNLTKTTSGY